MMELHTSALLPESISSAITQHVTVKYGLVEISSGIVTGLGSVLKIGAWSLTSIMFTATETVVSIGFTDALSG